MKCDICKQKVDLTLYGTQKRKNKYLRVIPGLPKGIQICPFCIIGEYLEEAKKRI